MSDAVVALFFLALVLGAPLAIYLFIREETSNPTVIDRDEAEREAMAQGGLRNRSRRSEPGNDGTDDPSTADRNGTAGGDRTRWGER